MAIFCKRIIPIKLWFTHLMLSLIRSVCGCAYNVCFWALHECVACIASNEENVEEGEEEKKRWNLLFSSVGVGKKRERIRLIL